MEARWARGAGAAALVLGALATLVAQWWQRSQISPEEDWAAAAAHARAKWSPGDAFRVVPQWDSRARVFLQDKPYVPAEAPTWFDFAEHPRVWALWEAGREAEVLERTPAGWAPDGEAARFGVIRAQVFARREEDPTRWDALGALPQAQVWRVSPGRAQQCADYDAGQRAWHCRPRDPWLYVGESVQTVTNDAHRCVWAMPVERGARLEVRFAGVPGGSLRGYYGQSLEAVRSERGAPVRFGVEVGGRGVWSATLGIHEEGFRGFAVALPERSQEVRFVVESEDKTDRFFCFAARVVEAGAAD